MSWDAKLEVSRRERYELEKVKIEMSKIASSKQEEIVEVQLKKQKEADTKARMDQLQLQQKEVLDSKSQPIRQYLVDNLVPILTDGLFDMC